MLKLNKETGEFMKKLLLIDGNSLMFRSFYATSYTGNLMQTKDGLYTNAVFGFCNMLNKLLEKESYAFVAFDAGKQTFRHKKYDAYKKTRKPLPDELRVQIPIIKEYLDIIKVKRMENLDYEADDLLATCAEKFKNDFDKIVVVTGDHDLLQLVDEKVDVALTKKGVGELDLYNINNFKEKLGFNPDQLIDYKGIVGDVSDNLKGIKGIGDKTAVKLLNDYGKLEEIYNHLDSLTTRVRNLFIESKDIALECKLLATLERNAIVDIDINDLFIGKPNISDLASFYKKMEFASFLKKMRMENEINITSEEVVNNNTKDEIKIEDNLNLNGNGYIVYDVLGPNYIKDKLVGIGILIDDKKYFLTEDDLLKKEVKDYFENENLIKYVFDYKGLSYILRKYNINIKGVIYDLLIASYLINPSFASDDFKNVITNFKNNDLPYYEFIFGLNSKLHLPVKSVYQNYILSKCNLLQDTKDKVLSLITDNELEYLMFVEIKLSEVLSKMEFDGVKIDTDKLIKIGNEFKEKAVKIEKQIYALSGMEFNLNSPKQLGEVLFNKLKIPYAKGKKKNSSGYSTSAAILEELAGDYEIVKLILDYRALAKLINTYVKGLIDVSCENFLHPLYKQTLTNTGRLSSIEPNIQNMPIRTELGQVIREVFVSRFPNGVILSCDYSQIELRILAHMSNDEKMISSFNDHLDFHTLTASQIFDVPVENVTKDMRRTAKAINFGIIYGMSPWGLSEQIKVSPIEANIFINKYFYNYPNAKKCLDGFIEFAKEKGYTQTLYGRRRYISEVNSTNGSLRQFGERTAMNSPIQGTAADIIKIAMNNVFEKMKSLNLKSVMIAQVHDELVFDLPQDEIEIMKKIVKEAMENAVKLSVPLEVQVAFGSNWQEAK